MIHQSRRNFLRKSLLASSLPLVGGPMALSSMEPFNRYVQPLSENGILRLNWNENPYGPSSKVNVGMQEVLGRTNLYPDDLVAKLKDKIAGRNNLKSDQILLTAGSTEVLSLLGQHVGLMKREILTPWPSFPTLINFGRRTGAQIKQVKLANDSIDLDELYNGISPVTKLIFICNPNNPTSTEISKAEILSFCKRIPEHILIVVDEAYVEFSMHGEDNSLIDQVNQFSNLLVCRTFSKAYGLAGLRLGYVCSDASNISALRNRHLGFELSAGVVPLTAATIALDDQEFIEEVVAQNAVGRKIVYDFLNHHGIKYSKSATNFLYIQSEKFDPDIVQKLQKENILITKWSDMYDHIRISIGKPEEMNQFVAVLEKYMV